MDSRRSEGFEPPDELRRRVSTAFQALSRERGFTSPVIDAYAPEAFGNCLVVLESPEFQIHVVRDRGQVFVDVGLPSDPSARWPLGHLVGFLEGEGAPRSILGVEPSAEIVTAYAPRLFNRELLLDHSGQLRAWAEAWAARAFATRPA